MSHQTTRQTITTKPCRPARPPCLNSRGLGAPSTDGGLTYIHKMNYYTFHYKGTYLPMQQQQNIFYTSSPSQPGRRASMGGGSGTLHRALSGRLVGSPARPAGYNPRLRGLRNGNGEKCIRGKGGRRDYNCTYRGGGNSPSSFFLS